MSRYLVTLVLVILTGMAISCTGGKTTLPSLKIEVTEENSATAPSQESVVATPTPMITKTAVPTPRATAEATATPLDWIGGPDWAWARALGAARGINPYFDGWIGKCEALAPYAQNVGYLNQRCFFSDRTGQRVEFTYDGAYTYYVYYDKTDPNLWETYERITSSLLYPLKWCPGITHSNVVVTVYILTPSGLENFCSGWR